MFCGIKLKYPIYIISWTARKIKMQSIIYKTVEKYANNGLKELYLDLFNIELTKLLLICDYR